MRLKNWNRKNLLVACFLMHGQEEKTLKTLLYKCRKMTFFVVMFLYQGFQFETTFCNFGWCLTMIQLPRGPYVTEHINIPVAVDIFDIGGHFWKICPMPFFPFSFFLPKDMVCYNCHWNWNFCSIDTNWMRQSTSYKSTKREHLKHCKIRFHCKYRHGVILLSGHFYEKRIQTTP